MDVCDEYMIDVHEAIYLITSVYCEETEDMSLLIEYCFRGDSKNFITRLLTYTDGTQKTIKVPRQQKLAQENLDRLLNKNIFIDIEYDKEFKTYFPSLNKEVKENVIELGKKFGINMVNNTSDMFLELRQTYPYKAFSNGKEIKPLKGNLPADCKGYYLSSINNNIELHKHIIEVIKDNLIDTNIGNDNLALALRNFIYSEHWRNLLQEDDTSPINEVLI